MGSFVAASRNYRRDSRHDQDATATMQRLTHRTDENDAGNDLQIHGRYQCSRMTAIGIGPQPGRPH
jgi:hypothetical protein